MLTDKQCRAAGPNDAKRKLFDGNGLYLELLPSGAKSWRWKYRYAGKERRLTFGLYPEVSLREARLAREKAAAQLRAGTDPRLDRVARAVELAAGEAHTFRSVGMDWLKRQRRMHVRPC